MTRTRFRLERLEDRATPATFTVNTTLDSMIAGDGQLSLREAISKANDRSGADVIVIPDGVYKIALGGQGDDNNFVGDFDVRDTVTIRGAGAGKTLVDGQQLDRVFDVRGSDAWSGHPAGDDGFAAGSSAGRSKCTFSPRVSCV